MEIEKLEKALRETMGSGPMPGALATLAGGGGVCAPVPREFVMAAKTLFDRQQRKPSFFGLTNSRPWI
jgi:hypothetical protein